MSARANPVPRFEPWPVAIVVFFVVAVASAVGFALWAGSQRVDLVSRDYYPEEIAYQQRIDARARARALAPPLAVHYDAARQIIDIAYPLSSFGRGIEGEIWFFRPSNAGLDVRVPMQPDAEGRQVVEAGELRAGLWELRMQWTVDGEAYYHGVSLVIE